MRLCVLIILVTCDMVLSLGGSPESICYEHVRIIKPIHIGPGLIKTTYDKQPREKCCKGYSEIDGECQPVCDPQCVFGKCVSPNVCKCDQYYTEPYCDSVQCPPGYKGQSCDEECSRNTYGSNCSLTCSCLNGDCDAETGHCMCFEGWHGPTCSECKCFNDGVCDSWSGVCHCSSGFTGDRCQNKCEDGFWGFGCEETCNCKNYGCNAATGKCENDCTHGKYVNETCLCDDGWTGETCDIQCTCQNGRCNSSGVCECDAGWTGKTCEETCEEGYYGPGCSLICSLTGLGNFICDPVRGSICKPGFTGSHCTELCPGDTFGSGCQPCACVNSSKCNRFTGECECYPGWYGSKCNIPCPDGTFGKKCDNVCFCSNCRSTDGFCPCQEGWNGTFCHEYCPPEYFSVTTNQCVEIEYARIVKIEINTLVIVSVLVLGLLLALCAIITIVFCIRRKEMRRREEEVQRRYGPLLYETVERPPSPIYEEIPEGHIYNQYNQLQHVPVEEGYLQPRDLPALVQNKLYSPSVENGYVAPPSLRRSYIIARNPIPRALGENQWRAKSAI